MSIDNKNQTYWELNNKNGGMDKQTELKCSKLADLAQKRKDNRFEGYKCIGDYHHGYYECDLVSPYTKSAGNVNSKIMVVLQDWSSHENMQGDTDKDAVEIGHSPSLPTNRNLKELLWQAFGLKLNQIYATNLFPFIKIGGISQKISQKALDKAAELFTLPEIRIVQPKLVICLGLDTYNTIRKACKQNKLYPMDKAISSPFNIDGICVWGQAHTGSRGTQNRNRGDKGRVKKDWEEMAAAVKIS